ncbi:MAG: helix-hairpin-helix domain-containing protein, partial [Anaerolineales bacterium]
MSAEAPLPNRRPIDLNTAPADALSSVVGIGGVLAERIVAYRRDHGPFASLSQLTNVVGIGPGVLRRIGGQLTVGEGVPATSDVSRPPDQEPPEGGQAPVEPVEQEEPEQVAQPPVQEGEGGEPEPGAAELVELAGTAIAPPPVEREEAAAEPSPEEEAPPEEERQPEAEAEPAAEAPAEREEPEFVEEVIEAAEVVPTKVEEAAVEPSLEVEEPVAKKEAVEERVQVERPPRPKPVSFWHDLWLVLLGGLAGVALTVIAT